MLRWWGFRRLQLKWLNSTIQYQRFYTGIRDLRSKATPATSVAISLLLTTLLLQKIPISLWPGQAAAAAELDEIYFPPTTLSQMDLKNVLFRLSVTLEVGWKGCWVPVTCIYHNSEYFLSSNTRHCSKHFTCINWFNLHNTHTSLVQLLTSSLQARKMHVEIKFRVKEPSQDSNTVSLWL